MKQLNTMKFVVDATMEFKALMMKIEEAETVSQAKAMGNIALGYIDGMTVFLNAMICKENNDFTGDFGGIIDGWHGDVYKTVYSRLDEIGGCDSDYMFNLLKLRNLYHDAAKEQLG